MIQLTLWGARIGNCGFRKVKELKCMKSHGIQNVLHLSVLHEMLLVRAGDVERNPGPETEGSVLSRKLSVLVCGKTGSGRSSVIQLITKDQPPTSMSSMTCVNHCPRLVKRANIGTVWYALNDVNHAIENSHGSTKCCPSVANKPPENTNGRFHLQTSSSNFVGSDSIDLIYIIDTRGQADFHCTYMLPLILQATSQVVVLCVINLSEELEEQVQALKECMNAAKSLMNVSSVPCKIVFVGTYKDKEDECMETREKKCQKIEEMIKDLSVQVGIIVKRNGKHDFIFPLNTRNPAEGDYKVAIQLRKIITEKVGTMVNSIPEPTFCLFLALQQQIKSWNKHVVRWSECLTIAQKLQLTKKSLEDALKHLNKLNMLFYSPDVLPGVILDQQVLVDKLAEIAEYCYHLRQELPPCSCLPPIGKWPKFQQQGILSDQLMNEFPWHYVPEIFTAKQLMKLLKYHHIAADIGANEYLIPCLLPAEELSQPQSASSGRVPPLLLSFNGTPPPGIFCALVCYLISHEQWKFAMDSGLQLTRKIVQFSLSGEHKDAVTLSEYSSFLKVDISDSVDSKLYPMLCSQIRHDILDALCNVLSHLEYSNSEMPQEAFLCTALGCIGSSHPAIVQSDYQTWKCALNQSAVITKLESQHLYWFASIHGKTHQSLLSVKDQSDIARNKYADFLRAYYTQHELSSSKWPNAPKYINLAVVNSDVHANRKEVLQVQQQNHFVDEFLKWKNYIAMQDILKPNSVSGQTYPVTQVLIEGAPGIGKSTFAWQVCQKWSQHQIFNEYSLVVLLKFRDKRVQEAKSVSDLFHHPNPKLQSDIVREIELVGGHGLLLILEGFDEAPASKQTMDSIFIGLFTGQKLPKASVILTTRPTAIEKLNELCKGKHSRRLEILGFGKKEIDEYIHCAFSDEQSQSDFKEYLSLYPHIHSMMYVPLNLAIITQVYESCKPSGIVVPKTMTQLYSSLIKVLLLHYRKDRQECGDTYTNIESVKDFPQPVYDQFRKICKIAYTGITSAETELIFQDLGCDFQHFGLMHANPELYMEKGTSISYTFVHLTIQEYLAAYHISQTTREEQIAIVREHMKNKCDSEKLRVVVRFLADISDYTFIQAVAAEREEYETVHSRVLEQEKSLPLFIVQCVLVGTAKSGKSSLMSRLTNLDQLVSNFCAVTVHDTEWTVLKHKDEGEKRVHTLLKDLSCKETTGSLQLPSSSNGSSSISSSMSLDNQTVLENPHSTWELLPAKMSDLQPVLSVSDNMQQSSSRAAKLSNEVVETRTNWKELNYSNLIDNVLGVSKRTAAKDYLQDLRFIHFIDTGGQPEFLEVLPALMSKPLIFFLVFDLRHAAEGLDKEFPVAHTKSSDGSFYSTLFGVSTINTRDLILQTLASIYEMCFQIVRDKMQQVITQRVLLVGTHSDHVTDVRVRNQIDDAIQKLLVDSPYYKSGMLEVPEREPPNRKFVYMVNNESTEDSIFEEIREKVRSIIFREFEDSDYKEGVPASWLGFNLMMRQPGEPQVLKYKQCVDIARQCSIKENDVQHALEFLHKRFGVIKYFKDVASLRDIVITNPQLIYDAISGLVESESCSNPNLTPEQTEETQDRGLLSVQVIDRIVFQGKENQPLSLHQLLKLLSHLCIAVPLDVEEYQPETMYFMPCLLSSTKSDPLQPARESLVSELLIVFDCGYCPKGLFTFLAATLAAKSTQPAAKYTWVLNQKRLYKNQVSFHISEKDLGLLCTYTAYIYQCWEEGQSQSVLKIFLEKLHPHLNLCAQRDFRCLAGVCKEICHSVQCGIVSSLQKFNCIQDFRIGFYSTCDTNSKKHIGIIPACIQHSLESGVPEDMICLDCQNVVCPLKDEHKVWFLEFKMAGIETIMELHTLTVTNSWCHMIEWRTIQEGTTSESAQTMLAKVEPDSPVTLAVKGHKGMANPVTQGLQSMTKRTTVEVHTEELSCRNKSSMSPTLKDLAIIPIEGTQWYSLGIRLGVQHDVLDAIEARYSNPNRRKREMFKRWLDITPNPSWNTLLAALDEIGATEISECVQKEYDLPPPPSPPPPPMVPALQQREEEDIDAGFVEDLEPPESPDGVSIGEFLHNESLQSQLPPKGSKYPLSQTSMTSLPAQSAVNDISHPGKAAGQFSSVNQDENEISPRNKTDDTTLPISKQSNIELPQSQSVAQESKSPLSPNSLTSDYASMLSASFSKAVSEVSPHNPVLKDSTRKEASLEATSLKQGIKPSPLTALTSGHVSLAEAIDQVPFVNEPYPLAGETQWRRSQLKEGTLSNTDPQQPSEARLNEEADSTENVSGTSSSSDTFHSFSSDNGTSFIQTRELDSQTFTPDLSQPSSFPKTISSDRPMAPVSPFPSVTSVGNLEVTTQEAVRAVHNDDAFTLDSLLRRRSISADTRLEGGKTLLMVAAEEDKRSVVAVLLEHNTKVDLTDGGGRSALHYASGVGNYEVVKVLLNNFANVNLLAKDGASVLMKPSEKGYSIVVEHLLENGANSNLADWRGWTPLIAAASKDQRDVVSVLLQHGADPTVVTIEGSTTALYEAAKKKYVDRRTNPSDTVGILAAATINQVAKTQGLFTSKKVEDVRKLVQNGAKTDSQRGDGCTPLIVHSERGNNSVVMELCKHGALVNSQDKSGITALMKASHVGHLDVVRTLLKNEAEIDLRCRRGFSALMYAVQGNHLHVVKELVLSQAELKIRDKDGRTALDLATLKGSTDIMECLQRATPKTMTSNDPFNQLLGNYLDKAEKAKNGTNGADAMSSSGPTAPIRPSPSLSRRNKHNTNGTQPDEYNTQKEQLEKAWKRIADLETRIHDLTLQATMDPPKDEDLSFLERKRLEEEYLKLKEQKKKAEHYAVEAKQTTQRLSAENFKLKEDLSRERHDYEFSKKDMLREMEKQKQMQSSSKDTADAKLEVFKEEVETRAVQLMQKALKTSRIGSIGTEDLKMNFNQEKVLEIISKESIRGNFLVLGVTGLPKSGKSALVNALLGEGASNTRVQSSLMGDCHFYRMAFMKYPIDESLVCCPVDLTDVHTVSISLTLARVAALANKEPHVERSQSSQPYFDEKLLNDTFTKMFADIHKTMAKFPVGSAALCSGSVTFANIWKLGPNKAFLEVLQRLGRELKKLLVVNVLNLARDADHMGEPPELVEHREDKTFMKRRPRVHYSTRMAGIPASMALVEKQPRALYALTHADKFDNEKERKEAVEKVRNAVHNSATEAGISEAIHPQMLPINTKSDEDVKLLEKAIEEMVEKQGRFVYDMPLRWLFFRAALSHYAKEKKTFYITRDKFDEIAHKCWIKTEDEIEKFIQVYREGCSLLSSPVLHSNIIIKPVQFLHGFEKLYYTDKLFPPGGNDVAPSESIREHAKESFKNGILCSNLARKLWEDDTNLYLEVLQYSGFMTSLNSYKEHCPVCKDPTCFFAPTLRSEMWKEELSPNSLFITCSIDYIALQLQSQYVKHMPDYFPQVQLKKVPHHNAISFENKHEQKMITIDVIFHNDAVEIRVSPHVENRLTIGEIYSKLKSLSVEIFERASVNMPEMKFDLAVTCPNSESTPNHTHFMPFHICAVCVDQLICTVCKSEMPVSPEKKLWINAAYLGPKSFAMAQYDRLTVDELEKVADTLCEDTEVKNLGDFMGISANEVQQLVKHHNKRSLVDKLREQQERSECCTKKCFAVGLMKAGCYRQSLTLEPGLLEVDLQGENDQLLERELATVASHISDWEQLAHALNVAEYVRDIQDKFRRSKVECCTRMLRVWYHNYESGGWEETAREHLTQQLKKAGYEGAATFLETGVTETFVK